MPFDGSAEDPERASSIEKLLEAPLPWIGLYVAAASLACAAAMAADTLHGLWRKKHWFPSRYFSINATSLTLLAVSMKLPVDLSTRMYSVTDRLAKISSLIFMSTAMANLLTSLGSMTDQDVLMNVTALGILVITVVVNVAIQVIQMHAYLGNRLGFHEEFLGTLSMLFLLLMFVSTAVMIPSMKRYLETKYHEMHRSALIEDEIDLGKVITVDKLRVLVKKYWVMAETSNPQFVIARSVTCTTSGMLSLIICLVLVEVEIRMAMGFGLLQHSFSSYGWSTKFVLIAQTAGVIVGTIAPASRWLVAVRYSALNRGRRSFGNAVSVEEYWTQKMVEWRQSSLSFQIRHFKSRKLIHDLRALFLKSCISVQRLVILASKLVLLISTCFTSPAISCVDYFTRLRRQNRVAHSASSRDPEVSEKVDPELDLSHYVMLLEGEVELPAETLENICKEIDQVIHKGKLKRPKNLLKLLSKSCSFKGVGEFDSSQVPPLHSQDLPYCWSLPVVTLACIALALPNVEKAKSDRLLRSVTEGLRLVKLVDKTMDRKGSLANIRTAADVVWVKVELYHKWQDEDLRDASIKGKNAAEILQELFYKAEKTVIEFQRNARDCLMKNPLNWPANVIASNAMYRMSRTVLLNHGGCENDETDEALFDKLSFMIADILAACLTNLAHVITVKCHHSAIEVREKSVRKAAMLLGETEEILALLQQRQVPILAPRKATDIEEWRAFVKQEMIDKQSSVTRPD
ncbi:uncharacterized protein LOC125210308 [Salvia hispanica]|uniref:uncharacterized protein LOC125210308 n=1 Tax=Salvia hispanica TaxID=49212 RepID=UPI0020092F36|nr:uncharacterized protein LOC125210308 [Salvia hispanica]